MEETSLSDFLDGESNVDADSGGDESVPMDPPAEEADSADSPAEEAASADASTEGAGGAPEGPAVTAAYRPAGGTCERCEATVEWLWTDAEGRVCGDCKDW